MFFSSRSLLAIFCAVGFVLSWSDAAQAETAQVRVESALEELHDWVGDGEKGDGWRVYLQSEELENLLKQGDQADRLAVIAVLEKYKGNADGLEMRRFVAVRKALQAWLDELPPVSASQLPEAALQARDDFTPLTDEDVDQARSKLNSAIANLDGLMNKWTKKNRDQWKTYLDWKDMQTELAAENPSMKRLMLISEKYFQNHEGLELPRFIAVRETLRDFVNTKLFAANDKAQEYYEKYIDELAERLKAYNEEPTAENCITIGQILGWLDRFDQAPELTELVRQHYSRPNLMVQLSEDMLKTGVETDMDETMTVREVILGTTIYSNATMNGRVSLDLVPNDNQASIDLLLSGTTNSNNTGVQKQVKVYSTGVTTVDGRKLVLIDEEGVRLQRARAICQTRSNVYSVSAKSQLVKNIAWKRIRSTKPQVEAIASKRAGQRVARKMDSEIGEILAPAIETFDTRFRNPLIRRGGFPQMLSLKTSEYDLFINALQAATNQLAAPNEAPELTADHDVAVRVHESFVANMTEAVLGGVKLTDERLALMAERLTGDIPEGLRITRDDDPWSVTFANERPIDARFNDNQIELTIRTKRFTRADQELRENVEISAIYDVEKTANGSRMTRKGEVNVKFGDGKQLTVGDIAMKTFVRKKFEALFQEKIENDGIALPGRWQAAGKMRLEQLFCDEGWLALGWYQPTAQARTARLD